MIKRELTDIYLDHYDLLCDALYSCWINSFCRNTKQLDKVKLKEQIRSYGYYSHIDAIKKNQLYVLQTNYNSRRFFGSINIMI